MKDFFERHKKECLSSGLVVAIIIVLLVVAVPFYGKNKTKENQKTAEAQTEKEEKVTADTEKLISYVKGIKDLYVEQNSQNINWMKGITYDQQKVKEVTADSKAVKLDKTGKYDLVYHITGKDGKKEEDSSVKVTVVDSKKSQELADSGKEVLLSKNELKEAADSKKKDTEKKDEKKETEVAAANDNKTADSTSAGNKSGNNKAEGGNTAGSNSSSGSDAGGNNSSGTIANSNQSSGTTGSTSGNNQSGDGGTSTQPAPETPNTQPSEPAEKPAEPQKTWHEPVYEDRYVVDQAAWDEVVEEPVYENVERCICNGCGADITSDPWGHLEQSAISGGSCGGYHSEWQQVQTGTTTRTIHHEEVGHTERVLVQEGYWG